MLELDAIRKYLSMLTAKDFRQFEPGRYMNTRGRESGGSSRAAWASGHMQTAHVHTPVWARSMRLCTSRAKSWATHSM